MREGLLSWAQTFHLTGFNDFYFELALWAIAEYYVSCLDIERKKRLKEAKEFCQKIGRSEDDYWNLMITTKPYHERLSLSESVCFEKELDTHELEETRHPIVHGFFDANTPFVFADLTDLGNEFFKEVFPKWSAYIDRGGDIQKNNHSFKRIEQAADVALTIRSR
ncbi:hypothetical protein MNQ98_13880 [Paenibacillus sp. N3/727]|uniref:hypothetical protein n=1 Tax=Paenibacillus sp. N3/727 TaxID=2925845 RepID=UPI001F538F66|nr:hypothetical protein [Paenibacillus sp. N3/727]UNK21030.1 hypothetical protein MNQ98_13880 [Paenibacillus sp. N3/727]